MQQPDVSWVDIASVVGSVATFFALIAAVYGLRQNTLARNLQTTGEFVSTLSELRQKAFENGVYGAEYKDNPARIHAYQMLDFVEHICFLVNNRHVTGHAEAFLMEWLRMEIPEMCEQPIFQDRIAEATEGALTEFKRMRFRIESESAEKRVIAGET